MKNNLRFIVEKRGYKKRGFGYRKISIGDEWLELIHWITIFDDEISLQMYCYSVDDEKLYDTGVIEVTEDELEILINIIERNHHV